MMQFEDEVTAMEYMVSIGYTKMESNGKHKPVKFTNKHGSVAEIKGNQVHFISSKDGCVI